MKSLTPVTPQRIPPILCSIGLKANRILLFTDRKRENGGIIAIS